MMRLLIVAILSVAVSAEVGGDGDSFVTDLSLKELMEFKESVKKWSQSVELHLGRKQTPMLFDKVVWVEKFVEELDEPTPNVQAENCEEGYTPTGLICLLKHKLTEGLKLAKQGMTLNEKTGKQRFKRQPDRILEALISSEISECLTDLETSLEKTIDEKTKETDNRSVEDSEEQENRAAIRAYLAQRATGENSPEHDLNQFFSKILPDSAPPPYTEENEVPDNQTTEKKQRKKMKKVRGKKKNLRGKKKYKSTK